MDLADLESIKNFSNEYKKQFGQLNTLINNAGIVSENRQLTKDGIELTFQTNYLGHFYLTNSLIDIMKDSKEPRVL